MTREEKIAKLNTIRVVVTDIIATSDVGLEFTTMTAKGVTTHVGKVWQWPCYVFNNEGEQMRQVVDALRTGKEITDDDILKSLLGETLTSCSDPFNGESRITDAELVSEILQEIRNKLKGIQGIGDRLYVYATTEIWDLEIEFLPQKRNLQTSLLTPLEQLKIPMNLWRTKNWMTTMIGLKRRIFTTCLILK